jgi:hypothetical protein
MPATTFPEYARELEEILNPIVAAGEATLVSIKHTPTGMAIAPAPSLAEVADEILKQAQSRSPVSDT